MKLRGLKRSILLSRDLDENQITALPRGIFDKLENLQHL
jgi:hypothetical protein